jgi:linoleoyl-CoA desaturase
MVPSTARSPISFKRPGPFQADLKARVDAYFAAGRRSPRGGWRLASKGAVILAWFAASWSALVFAHPPWWLALPLAVSFGLAWAGLGFDVMHDANHGASTRRRGWNRALSFSSDLIGGSSLIWRQKHNVLHHGFTNVLGVDEDLESGGLLRLAPGQPHHPWHRLQHLYVWLLYALFPIRWFFIDDLRDLLTRRVGKCPLPPASARDVALLLAGKALFLGWALVVPLWLQPVGPVLGLGLVAVATLGVTLATVFQLAHAVSEVQFHAPGEGLLTSDWATHQVNSTVDFARGSRLCAWYLGGLNFQVVHHLFPTVSHVHYPRLAPIVEDCCHRHGVRYRAWDTFHEALGANLRWLRALGRAPEALATEAGPAA